MLPLVEPADQRCKSQRRDVALSTAGKFIPLPDLRALKTPRPSNETLRARSFVKSCQTICIRSSARRTGRNPESPR